MLTVFIIFAISYLIGNIRIRGISLGVSTIMLVALVFGHLGYSVSADVKNLGLLFFTCSLGISAGPTFLMNFRRNAFYYVVNGFLIVASAALTTVIIIRTFGVGTDLALGLFTGALTSTPGFASASEATGSILTTAGYGISYPFGVVGVTLFCQFMSRKAERKDRYIEKDSLPEHHFDYIMIDRTGMLNFSLIMLVGILIGMIRIPLGHGLSFRFGNAGGPLIAGIIFGSIRNIGRIYLSVDDNKLLVLKNIGLSLFLLGSGLEAGRDFVSIIGQYGISLFIYGAIITCVPLLVSYLFMTKIAKLPLIQSLGSICGGMTSTPALGALSQNSDDNEAVTSYAATYPVALIMVVLLSQFIYLFVHY
ncbi:MAG: hypothetical protein IKX97_01165 [Erysipelotrichaceae bacterium]|nr:hypothetical protein [Erysipelotrichaceae bacterium]